MVAGDFNFSCFRQLNYAIRDFIGRIRIKVGKINNYQVYFYGIYKKCQKQ